MLLDHVISYWGFLAKNAADRRNKFSSWVTRTSFCFTRARSSVSVALGGPRAAKSLSLPMLVGLAIQHVVRITYVTSYLGHRVGGLTHQLHCLHRERVVYRHYLTPGMFSSDFSIPPQAGVSVTSGEGHLTIKRRRNDLLLIVWIGQGLQGYRDVGRCR